MTIFNNKNLKVAQNVSQKSRECHNKHSLISLKTKIIKNRKDLYDYKAIYSCNYLVEYKHYKRET